MFFIALFLVSAVGTTAVADRLLLQSASAVPAMPPSALSIVPRLPTVLQSLGLNIGDVPCEKYFGQALPPFLQSSGPAMGLTCEQADKVQEWAYLVDALDLRGNCPPPGFNALQDFSLKSYVSAPWYVQEQQPLSYQKLDQLYCVRAQYLPRQPGNLSAGLIVRNYENQGRVNGPVGGTSGIGGSPFELSARVANPSQPGKLLVGPAFLPPDFSGAYWVVAAGNSKNLTASQAGFPGYEWAIISGGAPGAKSGAGCRTGSPLPYAAKYQINGIGFWLFSRKPVDPENTQKMRVIAAQLGFDTAVLKAVAQAGCRYEGVDAPLPTSTMG